MFFCSCIRPFAHPSLAPHRGEAVSRYANRYITDEKGAISVEFVVIFPLLLALLLAIVFISLLISTASDVQQVAHDLARASLRYIGRSDVADICAKLRSDVLPNLIDASILLKPSQFSLPNCPSQPDANGFVTVAVSYNYAGSTVQAVGNSLGVDIGVISRSSRIMP